MVQRELLMKSKINISLKNVMMIIAGTSLLAFGSAVFTVPFDLVTGGLSSIAILINQAVSFEGSIEIYVALLTWLFFFLGLILHGKDFALKTLISTLVYPVVFSAACFLVENNVFNGFFNLKSYTDYQGISILLASLFGGAFTGAGCAICFRGGGSTGGIDVIALGICKRYESVKSSTVIFIIDSVLITLGIFVLGDLVQSLLGIASALVFAIVLGKLF